jgi:hypothetical protein
MREPFRIGTEEKRQPQSPHQKYGEENAVLLPTATGSNNAFAQA